MSALVDRWVEGPTLTGAERFRVSGLIWQLRRALQAGDRDLVEAHALRILDAVR